MKELENGEKKWEKAVITEMQTVRHIQSHAHEGLKCPLEMTLERSGTSVAHCGDNVESDSRRLRNK